MLQYPLDLIDVFDRGQPNLERVAIRATSYVDLRHYFLGIGFRKDLNSFDPINDNSYWLGYGYLEPDDWLFVYTGRGVSTLNKVPNQEYSITTRHWGRSSVLFASSEIVPFIYTLGNVLVPQNLRHTSIEAPQNALTSLFSNESSQE